MLVTKLQRGASKMSSGRPSHPLTAVKVSAPGCKEIYTLISVPSFNMYYLPETLTPAEQKLPSLV